MLRVLLAKDLRRAWRNPLPWLINLIVPLAMTALLGMVFGGKSENGALGTIRFAVVDEDRSLLSDFLRGAVNQNQGGDHLEPVFLEREAAMKLINGNQISAVLIIQTNFLRNYLTARRPVTLELIKNPAESIHPAVLEELLGAVTTALNEISRNFNADFPAWLRVVEGRDDYRQVSRLIELEGDKLKAARSFLSPPLVSYVKTAGAETNNAAPAGDQAAGKAGVEKKTAPAKDNPLAGVFAYLLAGLSGMFLLFLGQNAMTDLHREFRKRTFERYQTMHQAVWPFVLGKMIFAVVMLLISSLIMLGGGGLVFGIQWHHPLALMALVLAYSCFAAALFAVLAALVPDERRAGVLNNIAGMALGLVGGCAFPPQNLPAFLRDHVTPWMPSDWFAGTARALQFAGADAAWGGAGLKLVLCALALAALAAWLLPRRFLTGARA